MPNKSFFNLVQEDKYMITPSEDRGIPVCLLDDREPAFHTYFAVP